MRKITQELFAVCLLLTALLSGLTIKAQTPYISTTPQSCWGASGTDIYASIVPGIPGATNYTWTIISPPSSTSTPCTPIQTSLTANNDSILLTFNCLTNYTLICDGYNSSNVLVGSVTNTAVVNSPFDISITPSFPSPSNTVGVCPGTAITVTASGAVSYTWSNGSNSNLFTHIALPTPITVSVTGTSAAGCTATKVYISYPSYPFSFLSIAGPSNGTVCQGSSTTLTVSGAITYTWTGLGVNTPTVNVLVNSFCQQYTVTGSDALGCLSTMTAYICADTSCAYVWPGDANSDGLVDNTDALEIGLAYLETGPSRSPGGNLFSSQFATASGWIGFGSTGKRKVHVDCNGDGTIDMGDTLAIYNNYSLTHSFKPSESSNTPDISLLVTTVEQGGWNKADIILGSSSAPLSQLYGLAFDINFDNTLIEANSAYMTYSSSFLNASTTNVQFRKTNFTSGKVYAASVRTNGTEVNGNGKIGEFWFKVKDNTAGTTLNLSTSNSQKMKKNGVKSALAGGSTSPVIEAKTVGLNEINLNNSVSYFPNPASHEVTITTGSSVDVNYGIIDIVGREVKKGTFSNTTKLDVSTLQNGSYLIRLSAGSDVTYKKLVIEK